MGAAVWRLLAEPVGIGDISGLLTAAFPDVDGAMIGADVTMLMKDLARRGLVVLSR